MPETFDPTGPTMLGDDDIKRLLVDRIDGDRLAVGTVVGIAEADRRRYVAYGARDAPGGDPVDEHTLFEIGSITKLFTALLLCDMAVRGEVSLDAPVADLLPAGTKVPERNGRRITLADLATHRSGLPRMPTNFAPNDSADPYADYTVRQLYDFLAAHELTRTPGDVPDYSNLGAGLLGHALALHAGGDYAELVRTRILAPTRMDHTFVDVPQALIVRKAQGHDAELNPVPDWHTPVLAGAGALRSCASDVLIFLEMLTDHGRSPLGSAAALLAAPRDEGGLGLAQPQPGGGWLIEHGGGTGGFRSYAGCASPRRIGVVVLANAAVDVVDVGMHVRDRRWGLLWHRREVPIDRDRLQRLSGRYQLTPRTIMTVTATDDRLLVQLTGQPSARVFPSSDWQVFYKSVAAQISFVPGGDGRAARLILHQNGVDRIAERLPGA